MDLAIDAMCNIFVADSGNSAVRKITPSRVVTTFAGGVSGSIDGTGSTARFGAPSGIALDASTNIYVADTGNHTIRKITTARVVTTLAGLAGSSGTTDGIGNAARFKSPFGIATDSSTNVYVADTGNHTIRTITPSRSVTTFVGRPGVPGSADGTNSVIRFNYPFSVFINASNTIYVADRDNCTVRKVTSVTIEKPVVSTYVATEVAVKSATLNGAVNPNGMPTSAEFEYGLTEAYGSKASVTVAPTDGWLSQAVAATLTGLQPSKTYYFRLVATNNLGTAIGNSANFTTVPLMMVTTLAGLAGNSGSTDGTGSAARFSVPQNIEVDRIGNIIVADTGSSTIRKITPFGTVVTVAGSPYEVGAVDGSGSAARFNNPFDTAVDGSNNIFVADWANCSIRKITPAGIVTTFAGSSGISGNADGTGSVARFNWPQGVVADGDGNVYVADSLNSAIRKITPAGLVSTFAGGTNGSVAQFDWPTCISLDGSNNIYIADTSNHVIRRITPSGVVTTIAGSPGVLGIADGIGSAARFHSPKGVAVDEGGNVYVADSWNCTIRKITPAGLVTTIAGRTGVSGDADGDNSTALFGNVQGVAVDMNNNVYVADTGNCTIRRISPLYVAPSVMTEIADGIASTSATLKGMVNPNGLATGAKFEFGVTPGYGSMVSVTLSPVDGWLPQEVSATVCGLQLSSTGTTYHYRLVATNDQGVTIGYDATLVTTPVPPVKISNFEYSKDRRTITVHSSVPGCTYHLQYCDDLKTGNWCDMGAGTPGNGDDIILNMPLNPLVTSRFYRLRLD